MWMYTPVLYLCFLNAIYSILFSFKLQYLDITEYNACKCLALIPYSFIGMSFLIIAYSSSICLLTVLSIFHLLWQCKCLFEYRTEREGERERERNIYVYILRERARDSGRGRRRKRKRQRQQQTEREVLTLTLTTFYTPLLYNNIIYII